MTLPNVVPEEVITSDGWNGIVDQLNNLPLLIQSGQGVVPQPSPAAANNSVTVTFDQEFATAPIFVVQLVGNGGVYACSAGTVSTDEALVFAFNASGGNMTTSRNFNWIAVGTQA